MSKKPNKKANQVREILTKYQDIILKISEDNHINDFRYCVKLSQNYSSLPKANLSYVSKVNETYARLDALLKEYIDEFYSNERFKMLTNTSSATYYRIRNEALDTFLRIFRAI